MAPSPHRDSVAGVTNRSGRLAVWARRAMVIGLIASAVIHVSGIGASGLIGLGGGAKGPRPSGETLIDVALAPEADLPVDSPGETSFNPDELPSVGVPDEVAASSDTLPMPGIGEDDAGIGESDATDLSLGGGGALTDGSGLGIGSGLGVGGGGASFFGVEAAGSRFAYVVDVSQSMAWEGKIDVLRNELTKSVEQMLDQNEFLVVLYSDTATPLGDRMQWISASDAGKKWARRSVSAIKPDGGTNPMPGFLVALGMSPRPDAIYFMTDGEFSDPEGVVAEVNALNSNLKVPIHCICFVTAASEQVMKRIAAASGGSYTFVPKP